MIEIRIPGDPVAQGRPRFARVGRHVRTYDPPKSRAWKAAARQVIALAMSCRPPLEGPLSVDIVAVFRCPASDCRRRPENMPHRRPHAVRPDAENVGKAVLDAATGPLWRDDAQVSHLRIVKMIGAQGEEPGVRLRVGAVGWE